MANKENNITFIFDTVLLKCGDDYYAINLNYNLWKKRYLPVFDNVVVSTRVKEISKKDLATKKGYLKVNGPHVTVKPIKSYKNVSDAILKRKQIQKEIKETASSSDSLIIRMPSVLGNIAYNFCKKTNKKYMLEIVACPWDGYWNHQNPIGKLLAPFMYLAMKKRVRNAPFVLYVTKDFLQNRYPTNGVQVSSSDVVLDNEEDKQQILKKREEKISDMNLKNISLGTVASVELKSKGQKYVIKAIASLKRQGVHCKYYAIGNGNATRLKELVSKYDLEEDVVFTGSLTHEEIFTKLQDIDIYIQPSLQEGLPRAVVEAMSCACPIIATKTGGIPELIDGKYLFSRKNTSTIVKKILELNKNELMSMAHKNLEKSNEFSCEVIEKNMHEHYLRFRNMSK